MRRGITVIALIIILLVLAGVVALLLPAVANVRRAAARMNCSNNLKMLGLAIHNSKATFQHFPPGTIPGPLPSEDRLSFYAALLPFLESDPMYFRLKTEEAWDSEVNRRASETSYFKYFECPDWMNERGHPGRANSKAAYLRITNYVGMAGVGADAATRAVDSPGIGMFGYDRTLKLEDVTDGLDNTIMLIETGHDVSPWMRGGSSTVRGLELTGGQLTGDGLPFGGTHFRDATLFRRSQAVGFQVSLADTSVRYAQSTIHPDILAALATVAGGEKIPDY